jgi:hypothetical protein
MIARSLFTMATLAAMTVFAGCKSEGPAPFETPEATFGTIKKAILGRDADLMWDGLASSWRVVFEEGRQSLLAQPQEQKEQIAKDSGIGVSDIATLDAKGFFRVYFNMKKKETLQSSSPEIISQKVELIEGSTVIKVEYDGGDPSKAVKSRLIYKMGTDEFSIDLVKTEGKWLMDAKK